MDDAMPDNNGILAIRIAGRHCKSELLGDYRVAQPLTKAQKACGIQFAAI